MKTKKSIWRKIKGKWVNLAEISKTKNKVRYLPCNENVQTHYFSRTNVRSKIAPGAATKKKK
jgi:hypothetical protein